MNPTIRKAGEGRTIAVVGDVYRFLATGDDTNGKYALFEAIVPPGGGPPPHVHSREEEGFYVLEREITFTLDGKRLVASAGMFANMPVGTAHSFKNESSRPARMLISADSRSESENGSVRKRRGCRTTRCLLPGPHSTRKRSSLLPAWSGAVP